MIAYIWPIALVVISNTFYQICCKCVNDKINPFASLTITYLVAAAISLLLYYVLGKQPNIFKELSNINWASFVLGMVIIGLEVGFIYAYKAGWSVSTASIVQSSFLAVALIFVGYFAFKECITWNKIVGVIVCLIGLVLVNLK